MSTISDYEQNQMDAQADQELASHAENLKRWLEAGCCPECHKQCVLQINSKNITFRCSSCRWFAIYPIAVIGNSSPLHAENAALKEENERLKQHVKDLNSDLEGTVAECSRHHGEGAL